MEQDSPLKINNNSDLNQVKNKLNLFITKTANHMVINHAYALHEGVTNGRTYELKAAAT